MKKFLEIGKIVSTHGVKGEVKVQPWCDYPEFFLDVDTFYDKNGSEVDIASLRVHKNMIVMKINGINNPQEAVSVRNKVLFINRDDYELPEGSYFVQDLIGLTVKNTATGQVYGEIVDVTETGANDIYHVKSKEGKMCYIPAIPQVVDETNVEGGFMNITPLKGLIDDED